MKYLTPQLYVKINEAKDEEVKSLYQQWNAAGANARASFSKSSKNCRRKCSSSAKRFVCTMRRSSV